MVRQPSETARKPQPLSTIFDFMRRLHAAETELLRERGLMIFCWSLSAGLVVHVIG